MAKLTSLQDLIRDWLSADVQIESTTSIGGGCINQASRLTLTDGREFFLKINDHAPAGMFSSEAEGLRAIASTETIRVPMVIGHGTVEDQTQVLVLEMIQSASKSKDYFQTLGHQLAEMHRNNSSNELIERSYGFHLDNFIGSTPQPNPSTEDWVSFWREQRLGFQVELACNQGLLSGELRRRADRLAERLDELLQTPEEPPAIIHGDLWSGNYMVGDRGEPVLIDPATYFGHREAEFGMIALFGGLGEDFFKAYNETWPLHQDGLQDRIEIYKLYHLLNHLNLFGSSYLSGCASILRRFG